MASNSPKRLMEIEALEVAWQTYVGRGTTPRDFLQYAPEETVEEAVAAYVDELPAALGHEYSEARLVEIRAMLLAYIREMDGVGPTRV